MLEPGKYQFIGNVFLFGEKTVVKNKFTYAIANAKKFESGRVSLWLGITGATWPGSKVSLIPFVNHLDW